MIVSFEIEGTPAPQGSKTRMPNGAMLEAGSKTGRELHKAWRAAVKATAADVARDVGGVPLDGPLALSVEFRMAMPKSRPRRVRDAGRAPKSTKPDLDKLVRALCDGLTAGGLIVDDARLQAIEASKVEVTGWTGAVVSLEALNWPEVAA